MQFISLFLDRFSRFAQACRRYRLISNAILAFSLGSSSERGGGENLCPKSVLQCTGSTVRLESSSADLISLCNRAVCLFSSR